MVNVKVDRVTEYANRVVNGEIICGRLHYLACKRHLNDLKNQNTNEFPYSPAPNVEDAAVAAVNNMYLYSDLTCKELKNQFKQIFGYGDKNVIFTNGSDEALYLCFLTFCGKDCGVAFPDITYGFYTVFADLKPSGKVKCSDGKIYEASLAFGGYVEKGSLVRVLRTEQGRLYCEKL